jgi:hypothetical protein
MPARGWFDGEDTRQSKRVRPDVYMNVKDFLKTKYEAYDKHVSQNGGFGRDYVLSNRRPSYNDEREEFITVLDNTK